MYLGKFMYISTECSNMATKDMEKKNNSAAKD